MTDPLGQSQVLPYLIGLSQKGHEVFLLSCEKRNVNITVINNLNADIKKQGIHWSSLKYTKNPPVLSAILDIVKIRKKAKKISLVNNVKIVHCRGYITALTGLWLKKKFRLKFIFDMRGFFADERAEGGLWNRKNPVYKWVYNYFKKKEELFLSNADHIISLTEKGKEIIDSWKLSDKSLPITVIPCCADLELFNRNKIDEGERKKWVEKLKINNDDFILSYLGSIGTWYMLDEMLDFYKVLLNRKPKAKFLFITAEKPSGIFDKAARKNISSDSVIVQKAVRTEVPVLLSLSHVSIFFINPVFSKSASSPTKMGEIMGMGIPLICNRNVGDIDKIMDNTKAGYAINEFINEEYITAVDKIDELLKIPPEQIREDAKKYFSLLDGVEKYNDVYKKVMSG